MTLNDKDQWTAINALRTAAVSYETTAKELRGNPQVFAGIELPHNARLAATFEKQAIDARALADRIEEEG